MEYISAEDAAQAWGISKSRILDLCKEGRISEAELVDSVWMIPAEMIKLGDSEWFSRQEGKEGNQASLPLQSSVKAAGHTPQYRMHKYFARRPYNVFQHMIEHYTAKGDVILDCFCGGGVTVFEAAALGRKPIGVDVNPLAAFITRMQMFHGEIDPLKDCYRHFLQRIAEKYADWYQVEFEDDRGTALWVEWAYVVNCPCCGTAITLLEENKQSNGIYYCPNEACKAHRKGIKRVLCKPAGSVPLRVHYRSADTNQEYTRPVNLDNMICFPKYSYQKIMDQVPYKPDFQIPEDWDRQQEDKLHSKGIIQYSDFFTERNFALNCLIFQDIMELKKTMDPQLNEYLYFLFSSALRYTNKMARVTDHWEGGRPTAMDKHAFWLPNQYVETNILEVLCQRASAILKGCEYSLQKIGRDMVEVRHIRDLQNRSSYMVLNQSASQLPLPDEAVDVIITDPPYGSNVQYAELSIIWNAWYAIYNGLDRCIYKEKEAVVNRKNHYAGAKTVDDYEQLLYEVYSEGARTLKPNGYLVFTFNNKNIKVWIAMLKAVARAGFYLPEDGVLFQDYIDSYKNTAHLRFSGNIRGDFIYSFRKGSAKVRVDGAKGFAAIIRESIDQTVSKLFQVRETYTTPELYQKVLANMTGQLMEYILWCMETEVQLEDISSFSNDYLESRLKESLIWEDGLWKRRNER